MRDWRWHRVVLRPGRSLTRLTLVCMAAMSGGAVVGLALAAWLGLPDWCVALFTIVGEFAAGVLWVRWVTGTRLIGVWSGPEGWTEWWLLARRRHRWDELVAVEATDTDARLLTAAGELRLDARVRDWWALVARAQAALGQGEAEPDVAVAPSDVASWLGLAVDGVLSGETPRPRRWVTAMRALLAVEAVLFAALCLGLWWFALVWGAWGLGALALVATAVELWLCRQVRRARPIVLVGELAALVDRFRATPESLEFHHLEHGWQSCAWGSLRELTADGRAWLLTTSRGDYRLDRSLTHLEPLLDAVRQALAARRGGLALPRLSGDVPETALSRARVEVDAQRGLSRGEEPGDG